MGIELWPFRCDYSCDANLFKGLAMDRLFWNSCAKIGLSDGMIKVLYQQYN